MKVKIECVSCSGTGFWDEREWLTGRAVKVVCECCGGKKYCEHEEVKEEKK